MNTQIVYVLVSSETDFFYEQTLISATSLLIHNPETRIILVTDDKTDRTLCGSRNSLLDIVAKKVVVPMPDSVPNKERSRRLKTRLREIIEGDYLYIDSDTIICESLKEVDSFVFPIGMVWDGNHKFNRIKDYIVVQRASSLGYDVSNEMEYFNGGVMFVKDCKESHEFCQTWYEEYLKSEAKGLVFDQPPLMITNMKHNHLIQAVDGSFNCQLFMGGFPVFAYSKILHFFNAFGVVNCFRYSSIEFLHYIKQEGQISLDEIEKLKYAKQCFDGDIVLLHDTDINYYRSVLFHVFSRSKVMFRFLEYMGKAYIKIFR